MNSSPQYDPYDKDIPLKDKLKVFKAQADSIRNDAIDYTSIKTINFTNVRKLPANKVRLWSISNFDFSYSYTQTYQHNPLIETNDVKRQQGGIGYTYAGQPKYWEPFKKSRQIEIKVTGFCSEFQFQLQAQPDRYPV